MLHDSSPVNLSTFCFDTDRTGKCLVTASVFLEQEDEIRANTYTCFRIKAQALVSDGPAIESSSSHPTVVALSMLLDSKI